MIEFRHATDGAPEGGRPPSGPTRRPAPTPAAAGSASSAGFTLTEMLISIIVTGILGAGIFGLLREQNDFYRATHDHLEADLNRRGLAAVVSSEVRMLSTSDLYKTKGDSVRARFDVRRAVVCDTVGGVSLFVHDAPETRLPGAATGTAVSSPWEADFDYQDGWTADLTATGATPEAVCTAVGAPGGLAADRYRLESWSSHPSGRPPPGSVVRVYRDLVYTFKPSQMSSGLGLWRNDLELAAPFADDAGFDYVMDNGSNENEVSNTNHKNIRLIRVHGSAVGDGADRYDVSRDLSIDIPFRN